MLNIDEYLKLSGNNPKFRRNIEYVVEDLKELLRRGELSNGEYEDYLNKLLNVSEGDLRDSIRVAFTRFSTLHRESFVNLDYKQKDIKAIVTARKSVSEFLDWVDMRRHTPNNEYLIQHLNKLSLETINEYKKGNEAFWDKWVMLKDIAVASVRNHLVSRLKMKNVALVVKLGLEKELEVIKEVSAKSSKNMNLFDKELSPIEFDIDKLFSDMVYYFLCDKPTYDELKSTALNNLIEWNKSGVITDHSYNNYYNSVTSHIISLEVGLEGHPYDPLLTYYWEKENARSGDACLMYDQKAITKAINFGYAFLERLTPEFLIQEMVLRKFTVDFNKFGSDAPRAKEYYRKELDYCLEILKNYSVITVKQYLDFRKLGRETFS